MDAERDKREARRKMYFKRYSPAILGILMYGAVGEIKLGKTLFPNLRAPREGRSESREYPREKPVSGMHSSRVTSYTFGVFFPEKTL